MIWVTSFCGPGGLHQVPCVEVGPGKWRYGSDRVIKDGGRYYEPLRGSKYLRRLRKPYYRLATILGMRYVRRILDRYPLIDGFRVIEPPLSLRTNDRLIDIRNAAVKAAAKHIDLPQPSYRHLPLFRSYSVQKTFFPLVFSSSEVTLLIDPRHPNVQTVCRLIGAQRGESETVRPRDIRSLPPEEIKPLLEVIAETIADDILGDPGLSGTQLWGKPR